MTTVLSKTEERMASVPSNWRDFETSDTVLILTKEVHSKYTYLVFGTFQHVHKMKFTKRTLCDWLLRNNVLDEAEHLIGLPLYKAIHGVRDLLVERGLREITNEEFRNKYVLEAVKDTKSYYSRNISDKPYTLDAMILHNFAKSYEKRIIFNV